MSRKSHTSDSKTMKLFLMWFIGFVILSGVFVIILIRRENKDIDKVTKTLVFEAEPAKVIEGWKTFYTLDYAFDYPEGWGEGAYLTNKKEPPSFCFNIGEGRFYVEKLEEAPWKSPLYGLNEASEEEFYSFDQPYWDKDRKFTGNGGKGERSLSVVLVGNKKAMLEEVTWTEANDCNPSYLPIVQRNYFIRYEKNSEPLIYKVYMEFRAEDRTALKILEKILSTLRFAN